MARLWYCHQKKNMSARQCFQPNVITYRKRRRRKRTNRQQKQESPDGLRKGLRKVCQFCFSDDDNEVNYGTVFEKDDVTVHYFCMLLASGLCQNTRVSDKKGILGFLLTDIKKEISRGNRLKCCFCHSKGATIGCCVKTCKRAFHLSCGRDNGTMHQFFGSFNSYCPDHRLKQKAGKGLPHLPRGKKCLCSICFSAVTSYESCDSLMSPCCKKSWFHRTCIQYYAISAGLHYFKCPLCNSMKDFQSEMLQHGIYIPDQDASWEREPHAFHELLERHSICDAPICICPKGKKHDSGTGEYEMLLCNWCGSSGSHRACGGLVNQGRALICPTCASIKDEAAGKRIQEKSKAMQSPERQVRNQLSTLTPRNRCSPPHYLDRSRSHRSGEHSAPCFHGPGSPSLPLQQEQLPNAEILLPTNFRRRRGRPRKRLQSDSFISHSSSPKRKRGRPKGSLKRSVSYCLAGGNSRHSQTSIRETEDTAAKKTITIINAEDEDTFVDVEYMDCSVQDQIFIQPQTFSSDLSRNHGISECSVVLKRIDENIPMTSHMVDLDALPLSYLQLILSKTTKMVAPQRKISTEKAMRNQKRNESNLSHKVKIKSQNENGKNERKQNEAELSVSLSNSPDGHCHDENTEESKQEVSPNKVPPTLFYMGGEDSMLDHSSNDPPDIRLHWDLGQRQWESDALSKPCSKTTENVETGPASSVVPATDSKGCSIDVDERPILNAENNDMKPWDLDIEVPCCLTMGCNSLSRMKPSNPQQIGQKFSASEKCHAKLMTNKMRDSLSLQSFSQSVICNFFGKTE